MNPGICYLYEYKNSQKLRNVGFVKVTAHYHSCILQINARRIPVPKDDPINLLAFYEKESEIIAKPIDVVPCEDKNIYARLTISDSVFPDGKSLEDLGGFLLLSNADHCYAAIPGSLPFDTEKITMWEEKKEPVKEPVMEAESLRVCPCLLKETQNCNSMAPPETRADEYMKTVSMPGTDTATQDEPLLFTDSSAQAEPTPFANNSVQDGTLPLGDELAQGDTMPLNDSFVQDGTVPLTDKSAQEDNTMPLGDSSVQDDIPSLNDNSAQTELIPSANTVTQAGPERQAEPPKQPLTGSAPAASSEPSSETGSDNTCSCKEKVRKIQRSELSVLPRRCWNLANNSFLMHGYHNYNHLLLVEEDGHYWLGVPGVYAPREARAAELFGFPQFTQAYTNQLELDEDEHDNSEKFGYWCRFIR